MAPTKATSQRRQSGPRKATNTWDHEQRLVLYVLYKTLTNLKPALRTAVFNEHFRDRLQARGLPNGLTTNTLTVQITDQRNRKVWDPITTLPVTGQGWRKRHTLTKKIQEVAARLAGSSANVVSVPTAPKTPRKRTAPEAANEALVPSLSNRQRLEDADADADADEPLTPSRSKRQRPVTRQDAESEAEESLTPSRSKRQRLVAPQDDADETFTPARSGKQRFVACTAQVRRRIGGILTPDLTLTRRGETVARKVPTAGPPTLPITPSSAARPKLVRLHNNHLQEPITPEAYERSKLSGDSSDDIRIIYKRRNGPTLCLPPKKFERTKEPLASISEALAHPPTAGLFYRYSDENSYSASNEHGFIASRFIFNNIPPRAAPKCGELDYADIENHLNRNKVASPFISVSNCLVWIIRLALKEAEEGAKEGHITLIAADALPRKSVYYVRPYHQQLRKRFCFLNGAWRYAGTHEYIVWHQIPQRAVLSTFTLANLITTCETIPALAQALRLKVIVGRTNLKSTIMSRLQDAQVGLTPASIRAAATFCRLIGLNEDSESRHLGHIVSDLVQGWQLQVERPTAEAWSQSAATFLTEFCDVRPTLEREQELKMAFLHGVRAGLGDFNTLLDPRCVRSMRKKARVAGLDSPREILLNALQRARRVICSYEEDQESRYASVGGAIPLAAEAAQADEDVEELEETVVSEGSFDGGRAAFGDDDEGEIVYDLDD